MSKGVHAMILIGFAVVAALGWMLWADQGARVWIAGAISLCS